MWHESNNVTYVPLVWSPELAKMSKAYAVKLLDACNTRGIKHEDGVEFGENLAKNKGRNGWGQLYPVKNIVRRWVDREEDLSYPSNGHLTVSFNCFTILHLDNHVSVTSLFFLASIGNWN